MLYTPRMMKWTSENPTELGYYWVRNLRNRVGPPETSFYPEPQIVEITSFCGQSVVDYIGEQPHDMLCNLSGEWLGPVSPMGHLGNQDT